MEFLQIYRLNGTLRSVLTQVKVSKSRVFLSNVYIDLADVHSPDMHNLLSQDKIYRRRDWDCSVHLRTHQGVSLQLYVF